MFLDNGVEYGHCQYSDEHKPEVARLLSDYGSSMDVAALPMSTCIPSGAFVE